MNHLRPLYILLLASLLCLLVPMQAEADVFASNIRITQEGSTGPFDTRFGDGSGAAIRFVLSDRADSVIVLLKQGATTVRRIKATNYVAGDTAVVWDGRNDAGQVVGPGDYSISITTYDKGYGVYTETFYDQPAIFTRGVTTIRNPNVKNFGFIHAGSGGGYVTGIARHSADGRQWGDTKGAAKLTNTGATVGTADLRFSAESDDDGYVYLIGRTNRQIFRYHADTVDVALVDSGGYSTWNPNGLAIRQNPSGKYIAVVTQNGTNTASKVFAFNLAPGAKTYFGVKDTLLDGLNGVIFWDAVFGRDSILYATFWRAGDTLRTGVAKFNLAGRTRPLTLADTVWTSTVAAGRANTITLRFGAASNGSQDVLYWTLGRIATGNPSSGQNIYALTNLNASQPTQSLAYADRGNNITTIRSDIAVDVVGNIVYFENSNEEVVLISPPTGPNNYTTNALVPVKVVQSEAISAVRVDANKDGQPDRVNDTVTVVGIVNSINPTASSDRFQYFVQDGTGGITITKGSVTGGGPVYKVGDRLRAKGVVSYFRGLTQMNIADLAIDIQLLDANNVLTPTVLTIAQYLANAEAYEATLIRINGVAKTSTSPAWPGANADANMVIWDGKDNLVLRIDRDTDMDGTTEPVHPVNVVGTATQFTSSTTVHNDGYQISPNFRADFTENVPVPPNPNFQLLAPANNFTVTLNSGTQVVRFEWRNAVDLNGDALIYQWLPIGFAAVATGNAARDTFLVRTGNQMLTYLGTKDTVNLRWAVAAKDPANAAVTSADTLTVRVIRGAIVSVPGADLLPTTYELQQNYPNPFNPSTTIRVALPTPSHVTLRIYNILGQEVVTLLDDVRDAGYVEAVWNGKNHNGQPVASGMYLYRVEARSIWGDDGFVSNKKMMMLK